MKSKIANAITVDVEDYFQVSAFEKYIEKEKWKDIPGRVDLNINRILDLFDEFDVKGTFFVLGWIAERHPGIVSSIAKRGHEVASHGYNHTRIIHQSPEEFEADISKTKSILEDLIGTEVIGYRAASFSISDNNHWAHIKIEEAGYKYSSSIYPIKHDLYGIPNAPRFPYKPDKTGLVEIPISTYKFLNYRVPCGGGGYFRLFPFLLSKYMINGVNSREKRPCVFYFHPWELDPEQPRVNGLDIKTRFRHYKNLDRMQSKLKTLLKTFSWGRMDYIFGSYISK